MKFSIGIPAYKARFLKECIDSILSQTFPDFELIIVNDASPENIDDIVKSYSDKRIRYYVNEKNFGAEQVVDNWNKCLSLAAGKYIMIMGDDDKLMPQYLDEFNKLIKRFPQMRVYHCRSKEIDEYSRFRTIYQNYPEWESVFDLMLNRLDRNRVTFISDFIYDTAQLRNNGGFFKLPLAWASDDITSFIAAKSNGIAHTNACVFCYRRHSASITSTGSVLKKLEAISLEKEWYIKFLSETDPKGETEIEVKRVLNSSIDQCISKRQALAIGLIRNGNTLKTIFSVLRNKKRLGVKFTSLLYGIFVSIKLKLNGRSM